LLHGRLLRWQFDTVTLAQMPSGGVHSITPSRPTVQVQALDFVTLMSAFPSSRRVNSWLPWKRLFQALSGKAGGTVGITMVDHTLMRGSEPHDR